MSFLPSGPQWLSNDPFGAGRSADSSLLNWPAGVTPSGFPAPMSRLQMLAAGPQSGAGMPTGNLPAPGFAGMPQASMTPGMGGLGQLGAGTAPAPAKSPLPGMFGNTGGALQAPPAIPSAGGVGGLGAAGQASGVDNLAAQDPGLPAAPINFDAMNRPVDFSNVPTRRPGFFQHHGLGESILKGIGEVGLQYSAMQGNQGALAIIQNRFEQQRQQRQQQLAQQQYAQHRSDENADWVARQMWEIQHPKPDEFDQAAARAGIRPGTDEYAAASKSAFQNKTDPYRAIPYSGPEGEGLLFKRSSDLAGSGGGAGTSGGAPQRMPSQASISALVAHPEKKAEFDQYFGPGASDRYLKGGSAPGGAGTFPLYPAGR